MNMLQGAFFNRSATYHTSHNCCPLPRYRWWAVLCLVFFAIVLDLSAVDIPSHEPGIGTQIEASENTSHEASGPGAVRHEEAGPIPSSLITTLTVTDYAGINRINDPVTSGVPLPASLNITSAGQLSLVDQLGNVVPSQYSVLARWNGTVNDSTKPIKWVLVDFQANVSANATSTYNLMSGDNGGNATSSNLTIDSQVDKILVSTGKAKFQVPKNHFNLFDYVWIDKDGDGSFTDAVLSQPATGGITITDSSGKTFSTMREAPESISIEEQGPLRSVLLIRGVFRASDDTYFGPALHNPTAYPNYYQPYTHAFVYYNVRITFYNNKGYAKTAFTLEQNGAQGTMCPEGSYGGCTGFAPRQTAYFKSVNMGFAPNFSATSSRTQDGATMLSTGDSMALFQGWNENLGNLPWTLENSFANGPAHTVKKNNNTTYSGATDPGWMEVSDGSNSINVAFKDFWQNFYKKYTVSQSSMTVGFWPEGGYYPWNNDAKTAGTYMFTGGRHKTHEMLIGFYGTSSSSYAQNTSKAFDKPLMALAPAKWYTYTQAFGAVGPSGVVTDSTLTNEAIARYDRLQRSIVSKSDADNGISVTDTRTNDAFSGGLAYKKWKYFGWINFGDYLWKGLSQYTGSHEGRAYALLLRYLATGNRSFLEAGSEIVKHRYDIDQYHGARTDTAGNEKYHNYLQRFEQEGHSDCTGTTEWEQSISCEGDEGAIMDYTWNNDVILYYLLSGDRKAWDCAEEIQTALLNYYGPSGIYNASSQVATNDILAGYTRGLYLALNTYRVNGSPAMLNIANNIATNVILYRETLSGSHGNFGFSSGSGAVINYCLAGSGANCDVGGNSNCKNVEINLGNVYEVITNLHMETGNTTLRSLILRMADFLIAGMYGGTNPNGTHYLPYQLSEYWLREDPNGAMRLTNGNDAGQGIIIRNMEIADLLAYAYRLTSTTSYLTAARKAFKDINFYYAWNGYSVNEPVLTATRSPINASGADSKDQALIGRQGQIYLSVEDGLPLSLDTTFMPAGAVNSGYFQYASASGGKTPYTWSIISGSLPSGLTLDSASGLISGTPTIAATSSFTIQVKDSTNATASKTLSLTISQLPNDVTPPLISSIQSTAITQTSATITWTTDEAASSQVEYGLSASYGFNIPLDSSLVSSHTVALSSLSPNATYNFRVKSKDASSNEAVSSNYVFVTLQAIAPIPHSYLVDAPSPNDIKVGKGCTTAYHIDEDCDGYGVGEGLLGPDADDNDASVNILSTVEAKYGSLTTGTGYLSRIKNFFCTTRGTPYCNIGNVYFLSPSGNNATGVVNDITHPHATFAYIDLHGFAAGDMVIFRAGIYTEYFYLEYLQVKNGYSATKPNILAALPGEKVVIQGDGIHAKIVGMDNWYWVFDTFQIGLIEADTPGDGLHLYGAHNHIYRNIFLPRNGSGMWSMTGADGTCRSPITVTEDLNGDGTSETRTLASCKCPSSLLVDKMVVWGSTGTHNLYWGCAGAYSPDPDPNRATVFANSTIRNLISHSHPVYEGFQMNGYASNLTIENSYFHSSGENGINLLNGVWNSNIRNNLIWNNTRHGVQFFSYDNGVFTAYAQDNIVENNTIYVGRYPNPNSPNSGDPPISSAVILESSATTSGAHVRNTIRNNIIVSYSLTGYQPPIWADHQSFLTGNYFKNNIIYATSGNSSVAGYGSTVYTLSQFHAAYANSFGNVPANPSFQDVSDNYQNSPGKWDFRLSVNSPAINLGLPNGLSLDILGHSRAGNPDAGAFEYYTATRPQTPQNLTIKK
jgi:hypothetical protein